MANRVVQSGSPKLIFACTQILRTAVCRAAVGTAILVVGPITLGAAQDGPGDLEKITGETVPCVDGRAGIFECGIS